ncbi:YajQ family cyclic di-GMP-binding protein [Candidatus Viridilinea mediisalina]|uniref:Nucleotide-binding protein CJ255_10870 n=1 Tax=Candidatus Viridilinea mediisalina TaxID=2024553 RepID=A0A2A6RJH8_9CHLR|nr:YajQ family cyclic di-GMP-binding protein [Candidatus Viridilinea mediisalina]PDW03018.1 YajQ family cyclic di-GMP-binding protein [Candidatus Viridilinea mediisalina]
MAADNSFDIVSDFDHQEVVNAVDQALREVQTRYDLKDTKTTLELTKTELTITTANELALSSIRDIVQTKALRRQLSLKIFDFGPPSDVSGARVRQVATLRKGINSDMAKKIAKLVRDQFPKIQPRIQGETLRVTSKSRDDLQAVIKFLREQEDSLDIPLQFTNYR